MDEKVYSDDTINPETGENSDINNENEEQTVAEDIETYDEGSGGLNRNYVVPGIAGDGSLSGMYRNWFLDYASYVILDRAVPHIEDGLNPCSAESCIPCRPSTTAGSTKLQTLWATLCNTIHTATPP